MPSLADKLREQYLTALGYTAQQAAKKTNRDLEIEFVAAGGGNPLPGFNAKLLANWAAPALLGGFTTPAGNPVQFSLIELLGAKFVILRGSLILPNPRPASTTGVISGFPITAFVQDSWMYLGAAAGWNVVGRRSRFQTVNNYMQWINTGTDVAGEVIDMSALGIFRAI